MGQTLESAITIVIIGIIIGGYIYYNFRFVENIEVDARNLKLVNDKQVLYKNLYQVDFEEFYNKNRNGSTPFRKANPYKVVRSIRLVKDLLNLEKYKQVVEYDRMTLPSIDPLNPVPELPQPVPALPKPVPGLPSPEEDSRHPVNPLKP